MPDGLTVLLPVLGVLLVVILAVAFGIKSANQAELARRVTLQEFSVAREFVEIPSSTPSGWFNISKTLTQEVISLIGVLRGHKIAPIATSGCNLVEVLLVRQLPEQVHYLLTYYYVVSTGKTTTVIYVDMLIFQVPFAFPALSIRPQGGFDRFVEAFGLRDTQFESKDFNDRFFVRSESDRFAFDVLHPEAMEFFMSKGVDAWQISGDLIAFSGERGAFLRDYDRLNALVQEFLELIPDYVHQEHSRTPLQPYFNLPTLPPPPGNLKP